MRYQKIFVLLFVFCFAFASSSFSAEIAKYAGEFMSIGVGARALGMGGAYVAAGSDVTTGYWNPAGLAALNYPDIAAMHSRRFGGVINYDYAGIALPFREKESLGFSFIRLAVDDIPITALPRPNLPINAEYTDEQGNLLANRPYIEKTVNYGEYAFYLSYAKKRSETFSYGANVKFIHKGGAGNSAWGIGFDVGALWNPVGDLLAGVNFQDVTTTLLAWDTGKQELISPTLKTGLAYPLVLHSFPARVLFASDVDVRFEGRSTAAQASLGALSFDFRLGTEVLMLNVIAVRLGIDAGNLTAGAGFRLPRLDIDYAFLKHDDLNATHRVSLRIRLEEKRFARF